MRSSRFSGRGHWLALALLTISLVGVATAQRLTTTGVEMTAVAANPFASGKAGLFNKAGTPTWVTSGGVETSVSLGAGIPAASAAGKMLYDTGAAWSTTAAGTASQVLHGAAGAPTWGAVALASEVSGTLPVANGGTNSATALNSNRIMVSSAGAIVEAAALTNGQLLVGSTGAAPVAASITNGGGISATGGAGTITLGSSGGGDVSGALSSLTVTGIRGVPVDATAPAALGDVLAYDGVSKWIATSLIGTNVPADVTTAAAVGVGTEWARYDHVHALASAVAGDGIGLSGGALYVDYDVAGGFAIDGDGQLIIDTTQVPKLNTANTYTNTNTFNGASTTIGDAATDEVTINAVLAGGSLTFKKEVAATLSVATSTTAATAGASLTIRAGHANGSAGGDLTLKSGNGDGGSAAGAVTVDTGTGAGNAQVLIGTANAGYIQLGRGTQYVDVLGAFHLQNAFVPPSISKSGAYTMESDDHTIRLDSSGGIFTVELPQADAHSSLPWEVQLIDFSGSCAGANVTIAAQVGDSVVGVTSCTLNYQWTKCHSNGTDKWVCAKFN